MALASRIGVVQEVVVGQRPQGLDLGADYRQALKWVFRVSRFADLPDYGSMADT